VAVPEAGFWELPKYTPPRSKIETTTTKTAFFIVGPESCTKKAK
jgi:hypothetical protein